MKKVFIVSFDGQVTGAYSNKQQVFLCVGKRAGDNPFSYAALCYQLRVDDRALFVFKQPGDEPVVVRAEVWRLEVGKDYGTYWSYGDKNREREEMR